MESCNFSKTASLKDQGVFIRLEGLGKLSGGSEDARDSRTRTHKGYIGLHRTSVKIQGAKGKLYKLETHYHGSVRNVGEQ